MGRIENRADLLLLDAGSILVLVFGSLTLILIGILAIIGTHTGTTTVLVYGAVAVSILLALNGIGLLLLSKHTD